MLQSSKRPLIFPFTCSALGLGMLLSLPALGQTEAPPGDTPIGPNSSSEQQDETAQVERGTSPPEAENIEFETVAEEEDIEFEAVAEVEAPPRQPTVHTLEQEQLTRIPGTRGDALRAVEILPGVGRSPFAMNPGPPYIRGSSSGESLVIINGAQVPLIYHFGGLTSFFNSHLLEEVKLHPGNFSARYGRAAGGVVEARVRDPKTDGIHGLLELSALDSQVLMEAPLGRKTAVALAARRSNIDLFFDAAIPDDSATVVAAPVYWDYQAIGVHRFNERHKLRVMGYGSSDRLKLIVPDGAVTDPGLAGEVSSSTQFHRFHIELESKFSEVVHQYLMFSVGPNPGKGRAGQVDFDFSSTDNYARAEWAIFAAPWLRIDTGLDLIAVTWSADYYGPIPGPEEGSPGSGSLAAETYQDLSGRGAAVRPGAFLEASLRPVEQLLLIPGIRADYNHDGGDWTLDPRFAGRFDIAKHTTLKAGVGYYSQAPAYWETMQEMGNPEVTPYRVLHTSAGVEQELVSSLSIQAEGFFKDWDRRIVGVPGGAPPRYENTGEGYAYGLELLLDFRLSEKTQAFASYTLSRSRRKDRPSDPERFFDHDQTHNLSLTGNYDLGKGWLVGARFRYVTGNPYSKVRGSVYDANTDTYRPLYSGINDERLAAFHQLDIRGEKRWEIGPVDLTTYLEIFNVYNAKNEESRNHAFDYSTSEPVVGMPFFPNLGIQGEF